MSFWLSAIPAQNCGLNLKCEFSKKRARSRLPNSPIRRQLLRYPHGSHAPLNSPLGIVATGHEVVQEESHTYPVMTRYVRLFNNTLFPCKALVHDEVAAAGGVSSWHKRVRFLLSHCRQFSLVAGEQNGSGLFDLIGKPSMEECH